MSTNNDPNPARREKCARGEHCRDHTDGKCCGCEQNHLSSWSAEALAEELQLRAGPMAHKMPTYAATDDQLRAECARRKMEMDPWLEAATSDELLRELQRRGVSSSPQLRDALAKAAAERDEWKRRAEGEIAERQGKVSQLMNELKATRERAVAAEAKLGKPDYSIKALSVPDRALTAEEKVALEREYVGVVKRFFDGPLPETVPVAIDNSYVIPRKALRQMRESGPGIARLPAPRPNNSRDIDEADLLADDAKPEDYARLK